MPYRIGSGYLGSSDLQTSVAYQEIIPSPPAGWTKGYQLKKFSFMNDQDCHVILNNGNPIFIRANQGLNIDYPDMYIYSFKIQENNITFNWIGSY